MMDSAWGRAAALSLACALPGPRPADGLATGGLLALDLASSPEPRGGEVMLAKGAGFGLENDVTRLAEATSGAVREVRV